MTNHARIKRLQKKAVQAAQAMGKIQETMFLYWRDVEDVEAEIQRAMQSSLYGKRRFIFLPVKRQEDEGVQ